MTNRDMTTRYTDNDLLWMLANMTLEHLTSVSNRDIIRDKNMPTHHTYGNRFGSLAEAKEKAGLTDSYTEHDYPSILHFFRDVIRNQTDLEVTLDFPLKGKDGNTYKVPMYIEGVGFIDILPRDAGRTIQAVSEFRSEILPDHTVLQSIEDLPALVATLLEKKKGRE